MLFFAVALFAGTVTSLYPVTLPERPSRVNRVMVRVWVGAILKRVVKSVEASHLLRLVLAVAFRRREQSLLLELVEPVYRERCRRGKIFLFQLAFEVVWGLLDAFARTLLFENVVYPIVCCIVCDGTGKMDSL